MNAKRIAYHTVPGSKGCIALAVNGDYLYAAGGDHLSVYDIVRPAKPKLLHRRAGFGNGRQLAISGRRLYLTAREFGLWILDISDPAAPAVATRYDTVELATGIAVAGDLAFVAQRIYGIEILDCSNPHRPRHLSLTRLQEAQSAAYADGRLYVGNWAGAHVSVLDVRDPVHPVQVASAPLGGFGDGVAVASGHCYAATGLNARNGPKKELVGDGHGLDILRIGPKKLTPLSRLPFPRLTVKTNDFWTVRVSGGTAFVADTHNGAFMADISDPAHPRLTGRIELPGISRMDSRAEGRVRITLPDCVGDVAVGNGVLYIAGQKTGLHLAKTAKASAGPGNASMPVRLAARKTNWTNRSAAVPGMRAHDLGGLVRRLAVDGDTLYAACSHAGLRILRLRGNEVRETGAIPVECSYDVAVRNGKLYSAEGTDGLAVYSIGESPRELGRWRRRGRTLQLICLGGDGRFALCGSRDGVLRIFDVSDPRNIRPTLRHLHGGLMYGDTFPERDHNGVLPVIWPYNGLAWYDLSGEKPIILRNDRTTCAVGQCEGLTLRAGSFLVNTLDKRFVVLPFGSATGKEEGYALGSVGCSGTPTSDGAYVAFANRSEGTVRLYRITSSGSGEAVPERGFSAVYGTPDRVVFHRGRMLVPCGHQGLLVEEFPD